MKSPLPKNRLVAITLLGALLTAGAAVALAVPDLLSETPSGLPDNAPPANADFQPAVKQVVRHHDDHEDDDDDRYEHEDDEDDDGEDDD